MADLQKEAQRLELVDGNGKEAAVMTKASPLPTQCDPDRHCAHHGGGPFFCCRCGAEFRSAWDLHLVK